MRKFKEGDKIKVVGSLYALSRLLGNTGVFQRYFDADSDYVYYVTDDGDTDSALESDLLLIEPEIVQVVSPSVKAQIEAIETALATLKSTIGL